MSVRIMTAVWAVTLADSEKLVLLALADCANDEGDCWPSMATLVKKCSKSDRTVQASIKELVSKGHLTRNEVPGKGCRYIVHPRSDNTPEAASPPKPATGTPEAASDKPSRTIKIPSEGKPSSGKRAKVAAHPLPANWEPQEFSQGSQSRRIVDGWPPGELEFQVELFRAHHTKKADKFSSWQDAWKTWALNSRNFGNGRSGFQQDSGGGIGRTRAAAIEVFGSPDDPAYQATRGYA